MHDMVAVLAEPTTVTERLARRGFTLDLTDLERRWRNRTEAIRRLDRLREASNRTAEAARGKDDAAFAARRRMRSLKASIQAADRVRQEAQAELDGLGLTVPNLPSDDAPDGASEADAAVVRVVGTPGPAPARDHLDWGEHTATIDPKRAASLSGSRFAVTRGALATLRRALGSMLMDMHVREHGYIEHSVPSAVTREVMTGTGQLPKFEEDLFRTGVAGRELFLVPTAEVPLVNLYAGQTVDPRELPLKLTAHTPCFRGEAGSYGQDTKGMFRLHEFSKVELVQICAPEQADSALAEIVGHAERCLTALELSYRVIDLPAGDLGFSARRTFDLEVWVPSQQRYREVSSCSDCGTFQARRARIRRPAGSGRKEPVATLNGSALPLERTVIALIEQHQQPDGSVTVPAALRPYAGFGRIAPDGTPSA